MGMLLCAGAPGKRSALPHSKVMIHQPSGGAQGVDDMEINLREMLKLKDELYKLSLSTQDKLLIKCTIVKA
jgi:ATP-dependent Clp protease protease subunit